jgi:hypothetical protein
MMWLPAAMETSFACSGACQRIGEWRILAVEVGVNKKGARACRLSDAAWHGAPGPSSVGNIPIILDLQCDPCRIAGPLVA